MTDFAFPPNVKRGPWPDIDFPDHEVPNFKDRMRLLKRTYPGAQGDKSFDRSKRVGPEDTYNVVSVIPQKFPWLKRK